MAESTAKLNILVRLRDEATDAMRRMANAVENLGGSLGFAGDKSGILAGGLAAIGGSVILKSINAYGEAQKKLSFAKSIFGELPDGVKKYQEALKVGDEMQRQFGFDNESVTLALARFAQATGGNMPKALNALRAAMGLSVSKSGGVGGFEEAIDSVMRLLSGKGARALFDFGINLGDLEDKFSPDTGISFVIDKTKSRLESFSGTLEGQKSILKAYGGDILENLGEPYGQAEGKLGGFLLKHIDLGGVLENTKPLIEGMGASLGIVSAFLAIKAIPQLIKFAAGLLGISGAAGITGTAIVGALLAFGFWVLAIGLVITAGILLVKHWDEIKTTLIAAWNFIKEKAIAIFTAISEFFEKFPENMGRILGLTVLVFVRAFEAIGTFLFAKIPEIVSGIVSWFASLPNRILAALSSLPSRIESFFRGVISGIQSLFEGLVNFILGIPDRIVNFGRDVLNKSTDFINRFIEGFNTTPGLPNFLKIPKIPKLFGEGGIVTRPTFGLIGEAGAEAVIPLNRLAGAGIGGITVNLNGDFYTDMENAERFGNQIAKVIKFQLKL